MTELNLHKLQDINPKVSGLTNAVKMQELLGREGSVNSLASCNWLSV